MKESNRKLFLLGVAEPQSRLYKHIISHYLVNTRPKLKVHNRSKCVITAIFNLDVFKIT